MNDIRFTHEKIHWNFKGYLAIAVVVVKVTAFQLAVSSLSESHGGGKSDIKVRVLGRAVIPRPTDRRSGCAPRRRMG